MSVTRSLFAALSLPDRAAVAAFAGQAGMPAARLRALDREHVLPAGAELCAICAAAGIAPEALMLRMGVPSRALLARLAAHADDVAALLPSAPERPAAPLPPPALATDLGTLYRADCLDVLAGLDDASVDLVFADPPFNLDKAYPSGIDDALRPTDYLDWCEAWLDACIRVLKPGGSLFVWNLPRWCAALAGFLSHRLTFRHWIAVDIKYRLPIRGRLYPAHYALLYYTKGARPAAFAPDRVPTPTCPTCHATLRDYGGWKAKMNPAGVNLSDVWADVPPVRHAKYKRREGANELSIKLLDRVLEMASRPGDLVLDPFGGAGTTYAVAEMKERRWIGCEIGPVDDIVARLADLADERAYLERIRGELNHLFPPDVRAAREAAGQWTAESVRGDG